MIYVKKWLEFYNELFPLCDNQVEFLETLIPADAKPGKFLSVECGLARASQILANKGYDVTVTDRFAEVTSKLQTQNANCEDLIHIFNFLPHDIARYLGKSFFDVIFCSNYRLIFIRDKAYIQKLLFDAKALLRDKGVLVLDLLNFSRYDFTQDRVELNTRKSDRVSLHSEITTDKENLTYLLNQYAVTERENNKTIDLIKSEPVCPISYESFKIFSKEIGFSSVEFYSDYCKTPFDKDADKIVCVLRK